MGTYRQSSVPILVMLLLLVGCSSNPLWDIMKEREYGPTVGMPLRECLTPQEEPKEGYGAYGYVVFTERPVGREEMACYEQVCVEYLRQLVPLSRAEARTSREPADLMPVYWFLTEDGICNEDPEQLVKNYDYDRATFLAYRAIRRIPPGPVLLALPRPFNERELQENALVLDLSRFRQEDMKRAFQIWRRRICTGPGCWNDGLRLQMVKEECRRTIMDWSDKLMEVIKN